MSLQGFNVRTLLRQHQKSVEVVLEPRQQLIPLLAGRVLVDDSGPQGADGSAAELVISHGLTAPESALSAGCISCGNVQI